MRLRAGVLAVAAGVFMAFGGSAFASSSLVTSGDVEAGYPQMFGGSGVLNGSFDRVLDGYAGSYSLRGSSPTGSGLRYVIYTMSGPVSGTLTGGHTYRLSAELKAQDLGLFDSGGDVFVEGFTYNDSTIDQHVVALSPHTAGWNYVSVDVPVSLTNSSVVFNVVGYMDQSETFEADNVDVQDVTATPTPTPVPTPSPTPEPSATPDDAATGVVDPTGSNNIGGLTAQGMRDLLLQLDKFINLGLVVVVVLLGLNAAAWF